eukprot:403348055
MGAICCSNSLDRKDDSFISGLNQYHYQQPSTKNYQRKHAKNISPGKPTPDSDTFWELTDDLVTQYETEILFTKIGMTNLFEQLVNLQGYKNVLNTPQVKVTVLENGTPYCGLQPIFKTEYLFDEKFNIQQIVKCLHNLETREKWDLNIKKSACLKRNNRLSLIYIQNKGAGIGIQKRDFYEKKICFQTQSTSSDHKKHYFYFSSIESDQYPPLDDVIRSNIILGFHKFEVIPETSQVKATLLLQCDLKLNKVMTAMTEIIEEIKKQLYINLQIAQDQIFDRLYHFNVNQTYL